MITIDTIVSFSGLIYAVGKDVWTYQKEKNKGNRQEKEYRQSNRLIHFNYLSESGLEESFNKKGYNLRWSRPENIASWVLKGYGTVYEVDENKKEIFSLVLSDESVLLGKRMEIEPS